MEVEKERLAVATEDGVRLAVDHIRARGAARGAVWLGHAFLANRRSLDRPSGAGLASELAAAGLHAYTVDLRGHGESPLSRGWTYEELIRFDFPAVTRLVRERHPGLRVAAVGHSLTGHAAAAWLGLAAGAPGNGAATAGPPPLDALVTLGANVWMRRLEPSAARWAKKRAMCALMEGLARAFGRIPARALGYGSDDAPASFIVESLVAWARADRWVSRYGEDYFAALGRVRVPVLAIFGAGDTLACHPISGELFHRRLAAAPVDLHVAGAEELGFDPGHMELVTDARSRPLWRRIAAWLVAALSGESL